tara:strand:- start:1303 stop:1719 length:417 start_codon:yes stop_codon:yes gene_type:complete
MNSINDIRAAIEGRLATELATSPAITIAFQNVPFTPPNNASFVQTFITFRNHSSETLIAPGDGYDSHVGEFIVNVFSPQGLGPGANYVIAERVKDLYHRQTISSIIFGETVGPLPIRPASPQPYFETELSFNFQAWLQ